MTKKAPVNLGVEFTIGRLWVEANSTTGPEDQQIRQYAVDIQLTHADTGKPVEIGLIDLNKAYENGTIRREGNRTILPITDWYSPDAFYFISEPNYFMSKLKTDGNQDGYPLTREIAVTETVLEIGSAIFVPDDPNACEKIDFKKQAINGVVTIPGVIKPLKQQHG